MKLHQVFELTPKDKDAYDDKEANKKLLWLGERTSFVAGMLSNGKFNLLKEEIIPDSTITFSDSMTRAANNCYLDRYDTHTILLLCEVALGEMQTVPEKVEKIERDKSKKR